MKKISQNLKKGELKVSIDSLEDLWYLSLIIDPEDLVEGKTIRKIKLEAGADRKTTIVKKPVFLQISVEKTELTSDSLRVSGKITLSPDDISRGSYHTFNLELNSTVKIIKQKWLAFQLDKIDEACSTKPPSVLVIVHDREEAYFAQMKKYGYDVLLHLKGSVSKKQHDQKPEKDFYKEVIKKIEDYVKRFGIKTLLIASPAFFKEDLIKVLPQNFKKMVVTATCSSVSKNGIDEVLKRDEAKQALEKERSAQELRLVESFLAEISKEGNYSYGIKDTRKAAEAGAIKILLITDKKIHKMRESDAFYKLENIMRLADQSKSKVYILSSDLESGKKLDGLTGVGAILRYKLA